MTDDQHRDADAARSANARLLFWLRVPYVADVVLAGIAVALLAAGRDIGWWVLVFAAVRAVVGTIALFWLYPRLRPGSRDR